MKFLQKSVAWAVIVSCFLTQCIPPLYGQSFGQEATSPQAQALESLQERNSSFGSKDIKKEDKSKLEGLKESFGQDPALGGLIYQIHVLGQVERPGTYRLPASTRLSEAIERSGGILEKGSERRIQLRRQGGAARTVDLMAFKVQGQLDNNPYLMDNDVVFVPFREKVVQIEGAVKRPGVYEVKGENHLSELIRLVGGLTPGADRDSQIKVVRFIDGEKRILNVDNDSRELKLFQLENSDVIFVPHILTEKKKFDFNVARLPGDNKLFYPSYEERVFVLGAVQSPGPYPFSPYYNVRHYLTLAGGTTKLAKRKKIKILSADGKTIRVKDQTEVNPGDTIVIPERYMAPESLVTLFVGISSTIVGITATVLSLTR